VCFVSEARKTDNGQWQHSLHGNAVAGHQQLNTNGVWHGAEKHNEHKKTVDRQRVNKMGFEKQKIRISLTGATISKSERNDHGYCLFQENYQHVISFVGVSHFSFDTAGLALTPQ
jgi:hypothetical protein